MKKTSFLYLILFIFTGFHVQAQYASGVKHFENLEYFKAIPKLEKASKKSDNIIAKDATLKVANAYHILKRNKESEIWFRKAQEKGWIDGEDHYYFGAVLKSNNHYDEALTEFNMYMEKHPDDSKVKNAIRSCNEIKLWQNRQTEYEVNTVKELCTYHSEFCPVFYKDKLVFVSEQLNDLVNYQEFDFDGKPYLNVYFTDLKNGIPEKKKSFSSKINTEYHDGPVCFSSDFQTMYLTRIFYELHKKDKKFINKAKLYVSTANGNNWSKLKLFKYDNENYSVAHPTLSKDNQFLFFASDMPGGYGGKDLYVCQRQGEDWGEPKNLGPDINTSGDEVFPSMREDGILFFSSDGLPGFGELDLFSAKQIQGKWILNRNEGLGINSFGDDFGICFNSDLKTGYLSSNRDGGLGGDDIYSFVFTQKYISLDGTVLNSIDTNDRAKDIKLILESATGERIGTTRTDDKGYFNFSNLDGDKKYIVKIDETDPSFNGKRRFYYADKDNNVVRVTVINDRGEKFSFRNLPADPNAFPELIAPEDINLGGVLLNPNNGNQPFANVKVTIKDEEGKVVEEVVTNEDGVFTFSKLPGDRNYLVEISETDNKLPPGSKMILAAKNGKIIKMMDLNGKGNFEYKLLGAEKSIIEDIIVNDNTLFLNYYGKLKDENSNALSDVQIIVFGQNGEEILKTSTDANGNFSFKNLSSEKNFSVTLNVEDPKLANLKRIFVCDPKGNIIKEFRKNDKNQFFFHLLRGQKNELGEIFFDDDSKLSLNINKGKNSLVKPVNKGIAPSSIEEKLFYPVGDYRLSQPSKKQLDSLSIILKNFPELKLEVIAHTDSRGIEAFNIQLSQRRANAAISYLLGKGISKSRLIPNGKGESELLNSCTDDSNCSEEEHARNRRTEFKIVR